MAWQQIIRDTAANWTSANPTLLMNQLGVESNIVNNVETDTGKAKLGNGVTLWNDLPYWAPDGVGAVEIEVGVTPSDGTALEPLITDGNGTVNAAPHVTFRSGVSGIVQLIDPDADEVGLGIDAAAAQVASLIRVRNSASASIFTVAADGITTAPQFVVSGAPLNGVQLFTGHFLGVNGANTYFRTAGGYSFTNSSGVDLFGSNATTQTFFSFKGADVASAAAIVPTGNVFHVTGTTNVTSVTATNITAGTQITIIFDGILTFTDGSNLKLAGNFVTTADDTITLVYDGTNWYEVCRSVN